MMNPLIYILLYMYIHLSKNYAILAINRVANNICSDKHLSI